MTRGCAGRYYSILLLLCGFALLSPGYGQDNEDVGKTYFVIDPKTATTLVAKVGSLEITAQQFLLSYEFGPAFVKRIRDSKRRFLDLVINEKLLAIDGYARGLEHSPQVTGMLDEIEGDLATEELYKDDVLNKVSVPEAEIQAGLRKEQLHLNLQWLYSKSHDSILRQYAALQAGASFDSLFRRQLSQSIPEGDRSLETTRFQLERSSPELVPTIDTLARGKASAPVKGPDGWYIIRLVNSWRNAVPNESETTKLRYDVRRALIQQKADSLSDEYVRQMMLGRKPVIQGKAFGILQAYIGRRVLPPEKYTSWELAKRLPGGVSSVDSSSIKRFSNETLVTMTGGSFTVNDFLRWYMWREPYTKFSTTSVDSYCAGLEQLVWRMVRDRILVERATRRRLQTRESVRMQKKWWEEKLLFEMVKSELVRSIDISDTTLERYFQQHQMRYRKEQGKLLTFEQARDDVTRDYFADQVTSKLLHRVLALKRTNKIEIRDDVLRSFPIETDPKAIEVYTVKKGGTFPHRAFPTIDYVWQSWN